MQNLIRGYALQYPNGDLVALGAEGYPYVSQRYPDVMVWAVSERFRAEAYAKKFPRKDFRVVTIQIEVKVGSDV